MIAGLLILAGQLGNRRSYAQSHAQLDLFKWRRDRILHLSRDPYPPFSLDPLAALSVVNFRVTSGRPARVGVRAPVSALRTIPGQAYFLCATASLRPRVRRTYPWRRSELLPANETQGRKTLPERCGLRDGGVAPIYKVPRDSCSETRFDYSRISIVFWPVAQITVTS